MFGCLPNRINLKIAEQIATYKAIQSVPDADAIFYPRKSIEVTYSAIPFGIQSSSKSCVTVAGKAVRLKTDAEVNGGPAPASTPAK